MIKSPLHSYLTRKRNILLTVKNPSDSYRIITSFVLKAKASKEASLLAILAVGGKVQTTSKHGSEDVTTVNDPHSSDFGHHSTEFSDLKINACIRK